MRSPALAIAAFVAASLVGRAEAQSAATRPIAEAITVVTDDACFAEDAMLEAVRAWSHGDEVDARVSVLVEIADGHGALSVRLDGQVGAERSFERLPASCADRRAVIGLATAIALDATSLDDLAPPASAETPPSETPPASPPTLAIVTSLSGGLSIGQLPMAVPTLSLDVAVELDHTIALSFGARASGPSRSALGGGEVEAAIVSGHAHACLVAGAPSLALSGCVGLSAGALLARGVGFAVPRSIALPRLAGSARLEGTWWLDPSFGLSLLVEGQASFPDVQLDVAGPEGQVLGRELLPPAAVLFGVGARFRIVP